MRRTSKRMVSGHARAKKVSPKSVGRTADLLARIRNRREDIRVRVGTLSDSGALIREDRDR